MTQEQVGVKPDTLSEYDDDVLAEMSDNLWREADRLFRLARDAYEELRARLLERGGTILDTPHWHGQLKAGTISHTVDDVARFRERLAGWMLPDDLAAIFVQPLPPPMRVDHRAVNEALKLGGQIAAVIEEERRSVRGEPTLVLTRKGEAI